MNYKKKLNIALFQSERQALHWAACGGHEELASFLIEHGAEVDKADDVRCFKARVSPFNIVYQKLFKVHVANDFIFFVIASPLLTRYS